MQLTLYDYWRSGASHRVRIALHLKRLDFDQIPVDLRKGAQREEAYRRRNPQGLVPSLQADDVNLTQSLAILEWLEERFPASPLLPITLEARRVIRTMAAIVACDIHPLNNLRVLQRLRSELNASETQVSEWIAQWVAEGFAALEEMIERHGDGFAYGDWPTLADCCIIPQVYSAERFGVDLAPYPQLRSVAAHAAEHPAFIAAHPSRQPGVR